MRLSSVFIRVGVFAVAAILSTLGARASVALLEERSVMAVQEALLDAGQAWASVIGDGLQIIIEGEAPNEMIRLRAGTIAGGMVDASRVINNASVARSEGLDAPDFAIEILRNDSGVSLIGLIPAATDREALAAQISRIADGKPVTDLLEGAEYETPENWRPAMTFALHALDILPRSKISVAAGSVAVTAIADSAQEKRQLETELRRQVPTGVRLRMTITAPRPVVSPYITRFLLDDSGASFDACTADTEEARAKIIEAARAAGMTTNPTCVLALGNPSRTWGDAVALSIAAVQELGGGTVTISDADIALVAPIGTEQATFDAIVGRLDNALPDLFALDASITEAPVAGAEGPPQFTARLTEDGQLTLAGRINDDMTNGMVENFAHAKFTGAELTMGTRIVDGLPNGWPVRVLAGLEALSQLEHGSLTVEPALISVSGTTGDAKASTAISGLLVEKLGQTEEFAIDVTYDEKLDPLVGLPTADECLVEVQNIGEENKILFDPGSATLTGDSQKIIDAMADVLKGCLDLPLEIAGYTDSQGGEEMNQSLSQKRAEAVVDALRVRRIPTSAFKAVGYGEADPIADNETEAGREANRRIEFRLVAQEAAAEETAEDAPAADGEASE